MTEADQLAIFQANIALWRVIPRWDPEQGALGTILESSLRDEIDNFWASRGVGLRPNRRN